MKEMIFVSCAPDDMYFSWQYEVFIENVRRLGYDNEIRILLYLPHDRISKGWNPRWNIVEDRYRDQNVKIFRYPDTENFLRTIQGVQYIPLLRPYLLKKHFSEHPELSEKAIFYHDSDIVFTKYLDFSPYLSDDINYMSDTKSYINSDYWDSKIKDVIPEKLDEYKKIDPLVQCSAPFCVTRSMHEQYKDVSGGAQYLLKNIDGNFWNMVLEGCQMIRAYLNYNLGGINRRFFKNEAEGFQSWCADMWSILWSLWGLGFKTDTPKDFDFAWATDSTEKWNNVYMYHDAGVGGENERYLFNKRSRPYVNNIITPFEDNLTFVSKDYCSSKYVEQINIVKDKYYT